MRLCLNNIKNEQDKKVKVNHFNLPKHIFAFKTAHLKLKTLCFCSRKAFNAKRITNFQKHIEIQNRTV